MDAVWKACGQVYGVKYQSILGDWLKSLKNRVQPQPKQEWSEEEEKMISLLIKIFEVNHPNDYFKVNPIGTLNMKAISTKEIVDWLKSIKPNHWKPSEEQEALENMPRWKKATSNADNGTWICLSRKKMNYPHYTNFLEIGDYYLCLEDLEKLPKEE